MFSVLNAPDSEDKNGVSTFFVQMGQFVDHDVSLSTEEEDDDCCKKDSRGRPWIFSNDFDKTTCSPIKIPDDDSHWGGRRTCMVMKR